MKKVLQRLSKIIVRENLHRLLLLILSLLILSTVGLVYFEEGIDFKSALWWSIVTLTTVGYGDITPATLGGRIIGVVIMFLGIGILGMFTATIASIFVEKKLKENRGMKSFSFENHIILCEWNHRTRDILAELRANSRTAEVPIVLIAPIKSKPLDDEQLFFIQGEVNEENLNRANLSKARTVVILGNDNLEANARDAQVVLATLTVESINANVYTIVELVHKSNIRHCLRARADEVIVGSEFSSRLISRATIDHGLSKVVSELLSSSHGNDLYKIPLPVSLGGKRFIEVLTALKNQRNSIVLAVQKGQDGAVISNPAVDFPVELGDHLIVVSDGRPQENF